LEYWTGWGDTGPVLQVLLQIARHQWSRKKQVLLYS